MGRATLDLSKMPAPSHHWMMYDTGCSYTLLTEEIGRLWDGSRSEVMQVTGFVGETGVARGGGLMYGLVRDSDGNWRVECFGKTYVVSGMDECLLGGHGVQMHGLGATLRPSGGAELMNTAGVKYELEMNEQDRTYRLPIIVYH